MKFTSKAHNEGWIDNNAEDIAEMMEQIIEDINDDCYDSFEDLLNDCYRWYITEFTADELNTLKQAFEKRQTEREIEAEEAESYDEYDGPDYMDIAHEIIEMERLGWTA